MPLDFNEIRQLLATIAQTDITEVTLKSDDFEITVRKAQSLSNQILASPQTGLGVVGTGLATSPQLPQVISTPQDIATRGASNNSGSEGTQPATTSAPPTHEQKWQEIYSPMVGTFYRAPSPTDPPFVEVGDRIRSSQTVCIIEAMKLMNEIEAEVSGQVIEILVQNGEPVEYGQPLMLINPD